MPPALLTKQQLAERLGISINGLDGLVRKRKIPAIKISHRCVRFDWLKVRAALDKFEQREVE